MSDVRRDDATAVAGVSMFGAGRTANHYALKRAYLGKKPPTRLFNERRLFTRNHHGGRPLLALGTALTTVGAAAGTTGIVNRVQHRKSVPLVKRDSKHSSFLNEARLGVTDSMRDRVHTTANPTPPHLMLENYAAGGLASAVGGGLANFALGKTKIHRGLGAGLAGAAGLTTGALTMPLQSKLISRQSRGKYEVTPTGVRRKKKDVIKALRFKTENVRELLDEAPRFRSPSTQPMVSRKRVGELRNVYREQRFLTSRGRPRRTSDTEIKNAAKQEVARHSGIAKYVVTPAGVRRKAKEPVEKMTPRLVHHVTSTKNAKSIIEGGFRVNPHADLPGIYNLPKKIWQGGRKDKVITSMASGPPMAHKILRGLTPTIEEHVYHPGQLIPVSTTHMGRRPRSVSKTVSIRKDDYFGRDMTSGQKRARVMGSTAIPIIPFAGGIAAASMAASMAPPELRKKTAALQFGGDQGGGISAAAAGSYGAVALARSKKVQSAGAKVSAAAARHPKAVSRARAPRRLLDRGSAGLRHGMGLKPANPVSPLIRASQHPRTPKLVRGALKPLMRNPKVAIAAGMGSMAVGGQAGGYVGYGHALKLERARNNKSADNRHGVSKRSAVMTPAQTHKQAKKKRLQANISMFTGTTGIGALAAGIASKSPRLSVKAAEKLKGYQTPLLAAGAGVGGAGSFNFARYTRDEANAQDKGVVKALNFHRAYMRAGGLVRRRNYLGAMSTSTRRGGLVR